MNITGNVTVRGTMPDDPINGVFSISGNISQSCTSGPGIGQNRNYLNLDASKNWTGESKKIGLIKRSIFLNIIYKN